VREVVVTADKISHPAIFLNDADALTDSLRALREAGNESLLVHDDPQGETQAANFTPTSKSLYIYVPLQFRKKPGLS
jgi:hypothetical protein